MDTILYFRKKRGLQEPEIEPVGLKAYLLIRIGLDVESGKWFGRELGRGPARKPEEKADSAGAQEASDSAGKDKAVPEEPKGFRHWLWTLCHPIQSRHNALRGRRPGEGMAAEEAFAFQERMREEIEASMRRIATEVRELAGEDAECFCVYEDSLRRALIKEELSGRTVLSSRGVPVGMDTMPVERECLSILWEKCIPIKEFTGYSQRFWVELLCARATCPHFIILGTAPCLFDVIEAHAYRMKSLKWMLLEDGYDEEAIAFVEEFYTEYGLAITVQPFSDVAALKRLQLTCREPVNILDFTGEDFTAVWEVPEGSVWLDVFSVEEKRRRILSRGKVISYVSLKEIWKSAQKRCNCPILP